jgi:hypothetical protein
MELRIMLIDDVAVQYLTTRKVRLTWTGVEGRSAYIFINGERKHGPLTFTGTSRTFDTVVPNPFLIEVHELRDGEEVLAAGIPLARRPTVWWSARTGAQSYTVYCQANESASEASAAVVKGDEISRHFEAQLKNDIRGEESAWARLRVEARNARGQESVRDPFPLFVASLPKRPAALNVTGSGGVFDFELEL